MGLIFQRNDERFAQLHNLLSESFARVKQDSTLLTQWIEYLYHLSIEQQRALNDLRTRNNQLHTALIDLERYNRRQNEAIGDLQLQLKHMPTTREDVRKIVDSFYSFEPLLVRIKHVEEKLAEKEAQKAIPAQSVSQHPVQNAANALQERILRRITRNSKNFIKSSILSLIAKYGKISALQLREIVVDEQGLCSKSSFYRLLEELEKNEGLHPVFDGREKMYGLDHHAPKIKSS